MIAARTLLLLAVVIWGWTFVATKVCLDYLSPPELLSARFALALPVLWILLRRRRVRLDFRGHEKPLAIGAALFALHFAVQVTGLQYTSATNTGWIIAVTPLVIGGVALAQTRRRRPKLIGIAGGSGSGKSALASELGRSLRAPVLSLDDYYLDASPRGQRNFDHPDSLDWELFTGHFHALAAGRPIEAPCYDFERHRRGGSRTVRGSGPWLILEGNLLLHEPELRERLDLKVFLDAPDALRLERRLERDTRRRGRTAQSVREQYAETVRPMYERYVEPTREHADLVLDATRSLPENVARVVEYAAGPDGAA